MFVVDDIKNKYNEKLREYYDELKRGGISTSALRNFKESSANAQLNYLGEMTVRKNMTEFINILIEEEGIQSQRAVKIARKIFKSQVKDALNSALIEAKSKEDESYYKNHPIQKTADQIGCFWALFIIVGLCYAVNVIFGIIITFIALYTLYEIYINK